MFDLIKQFYGSFMLSVLKVLHSVSICILRIKGAQIGRHTFILNNLLKQPGLDPANIKIGSKCVICDEVLLLSDDCYRRLLPPDSKDEATKKGIIINDNCFIGIGAIILNGVTVGPNSIVGAGAVVVSDVKPNSCVAGNTSRFVCSLESYAKASKRNVIKGYKSENKSKSEFLKSYFWPMLRKE
ncbi:MAG: acyltransferase [Acetivibrionales bacterium]